MDGVYKYCFSNQMSTMTPKIVMFDMVIGEAPGEPGAEGDDDASHNKLEDMIKQLSVALTGKNNNYYLNDNSWKFVHTFGKNWFIDVFW